MIVGTPHGRRNPQFLGVHAYLFSIKRAGISEVTTDVGMQIIGGARTRRAGRPPGLAPSS